MVAKDKLAKLTIREKHLSILAGMADLGMIGYYTGDEEFPGELCGACTYDIIHKDKKTFTDIWKNDFPGCFEGKGIPYNTDQRLATAEDIVRELGHIFEDDFELLTEANARK